MKSTGIVRQVDHVGRVTLPREMLNSLGLSRGTPLEFYVDGEMIVLKKHFHHCLLCGDSQATIIYEKGYVCDACAGRLGVS